MITTLINYHGQDYHNDCHTGPVVAVYAFLGHCALSKARTFEQRRRSRCPACQGSWPDQGRFTRMQRTHHASKAPKAFWYSSSASAFGRSVCSTQRPADRSLQSRQASPNFTFSSPFFLKRDPTPSLTAPCTSGALKVTSTTTGFCISCRASPGTTPKMSPNRQPPSPQPSSCV